MSSSSWVWRELALPSRIDPSAATDALTALAGLPGHPLVALEAIGRDGTVEWRLGARTDVYRAVVAAFRAHIPSLRDEAGQQVDSVSQVTSVRLPASRRWPLNHHGTAPAIRGLLSVFASTTPTESLRIQVLLGPRSHPSRTPKNGTGGYRTPESVSKKAKETRFACEIRIGASAASPTRVRSLINQAAAALRALDAPGNHLHLVRRHVAAFDGARAPWLWRVTLSAAELAAFTGWPIADATAGPLPAVPPTHPATLVATSAVARSGRILGDSPLQRDRPIAISQDDSSRHLHVLGPTGVGKSSLLGNLALQDIEAGQGAVVVDPKYDLIRDLLERIPEHRRDDVVVLDPTDPSPIGLQPLGGHDALSADLSADVILGVFHSLYRDSWGPRTHDILHAALLTLARRGDASLVMVPLLLTNPGLRRSITGRIARNDPMGLGTFWAWYEQLSDAERSQTIAPLMNKLRSVLLRPGLRGIFGQRAPRFALGDVFSKRRILLVALRKDAIGDEAAHLLGSLVVSFVWQAAKARTAVPQHARMPVSIVLDEFQDVVRLHGDVSDALAQARSLGVSFTLAHQYLKQVPQSLRDAVTGTVRSRVVFSTNSSDARELAATTEQLQAEDFRALPRFQAYAQLLAGGSPQGWCSLQTRPLPSPCSNATELLQHSRSSYGQPLSDVEADLLEFIQPAANAPAQQFGRRRNPFNPNDQSASTKGDAS
ncbi:hypothetical protein EK0264_04130 [Epidermidibacterium keratini]|uniref:Type IV secretion system DNA-binding domain-containing protein n=1 Tax=Epidermidibacterium keratini TaxID=1891644 RepID=A0A7L4YKZ3_9ACTN|nr:hypothetical protein [Epidermidibacterium keratini]QHB99552.1 hypothetical protein EK0264_04130 [Epidermidibacterium keratini]